MRYSEVLLMYAEACANTSELTEALDKLNMVKRRAFAKGAQTQEEVAALDANFWLVPDSAVDFNSTDTNIIIDEIVEERKYEFLGEIGGNRWLDLIRLERVAQANANRDPRDVPIIGDPSDSKLWFTPIPFNETVLNPNLLIPVD